MIGRITDFDYNPISHKSLVTLEVNAKPSIIEGLYNLNKDLDVTIKEHKERRSLDANSYYWILTTQLAKKLHVSVPYLHNTMLRRCGYYLDIDGKITCITLPDTEVAEKWADENETVHLAPTSGTITNSKGETFRWYKMLRGSSDLNTAEFSRLVELLVQDCKEQGIETLTPDELKRMFGDGKHNAER